MRRLLIGAIAVAVAAPFAAAAASGPETSAQTRVAICHKTTSKARPYVKLTVRTSAALRLHQRHAADIIPAPAGPCPRTLLTATSGGTAISTDLLGIVERPEPGDPDGSGRATIRLRRGQGQVCFRLSVDDIQLPAIGAHIHRGNANVAGPIVLGLRSPGANGVASGCVTAARSLVGQILARRAGFYVNVHTTAFPEGAIRGQLAPTAGVRFFVVDLRGSEEVPPADPEGTGTAGVRMQTGQNEVCFTIVVRNLELPTIGAHIHRGARGVVGPVIIPFTAPGASGTSTGCVTADEGLVPEILANPAGFYVNVHTNRFPGGAARGQLD